MNRGNKAHDLMEVVFSYFALWQHWFGRAKLSHKTAIKQFLSAEDGRLVNVKCGFR